MNGFSSRGIHGILFMMAVWAGSVSGAEAAEAVDLENGRRLHDRHCLRCHSTDVYTRPDRQIRSLPQLRSRVRDCELGAELTWFDEEVEDVVLWLNQEHYHFPVLSDTDLPDK